MSGGFFRGTSADQDTRFSNKQAKLLKSQKFAPELDRLVDMTKVRKEVMQPWIARRVTELLGFEDEVLINFIYTLLEGKEVNGKEVQIALTGFMEKNTGKFMKELWTMLLSAQQTASGVPQQLLDAKAEEVQKKQADDHRITTRIEMTRDEESKELQLGRSKKMDDGVETRVTNFDMELASRGMQPKGSTPHSGNDEDKEKRNDTRGRSRFSGSPPSADRDSPSLIRRSSSHSRSNSGKSRSESRSPEAKRCSISSDRVNRSSRRRSITPPARHSPRISPSPSRRSYFRRRSRSPSGSRSPSPIQRRFGSYRRRSPSPMRRRSPSPMRRRSPSPIRRRRSPSPSWRRRLPSPSWRRGSPSPLRHRRSPSPWRRRRSPSPLRHRRSPSPSRRRRLPSPVKRRRMPSPIRHHKQSPSDRQHWSTSRQRHWSPSPERRRSPSPIHRKSPTPVRRDAPSLVRRSSVSPLPRRYQRSPLTSHSRSVSPAQRSPIPSRQRLHTPHDGPASPYESSSLSPVRHKSSPLNRKSPREYQRSPAPPLKEKVWARQNLSPVPRRPSSPSISPLRDPKDPKDLCRDVPAPSPSPVASPRQPKSPMSRSLSEDRRSSSPHEVTMRQRRQRLVHDGSLAPQRSREQNARNASTDINKEEEAEHIRGRRDYKCRSSQKLSTHSPVINKQNDSPIRAHNKNDQSSERAAGPSRHGDKSEKSLRKGVNSGAPDVRISPTLPHNLLLEEKKQAGKKSDEKNGGSSNIVKDQGHESETRKMVVEKADQTNGSGTLNSDSEEIGKHRTQNKEKRKHRRSHRRELASEDDEYDSEIEDRKEAKRRKKEEKKLRKEKRRRREERRRRKEKEERRAEKLKLKNRSDDYSSDYEHAGRSDSHRSNNEEVRDEQKKLEIELRKKALELYKAKKGISH